MSWRDNLKPASFRGVPFFISAHDYEFGRKNVFHDYPFRDTAEVEDQGASTDGFSLTAYVVSNGKNSFDYFSERDKLIDALKSPGPGLLVHRYLGNKTVAVSGAVRMSEQFAEGGIARFQISFKEVELKQPFITIDPVSSIDTVAKDSSERTLDAYTELMQTGADLQKVANVATSGMQTAIAKLRELKSLPGSVISIATGLALQASTNIEAVASLSPCEVGQAISGGMDAFLFAAGMLEGSVSRTISGSCSGRTINAEDAERNSDQLEQTEGIAIVQAAIGVATFADLFPDITVVSTASAEDQANRYNTINYIRSQSLINACRIAVRISFVSQDDANLVLILISNAIDEFLEFLGEQAGSEVLASYNVVFSNDDIYQSILQLKPALKTALDAIGASLAKIIDFEVGPDVVSSLSLAYDKYEDLDRDQEIIDRNPLLICNPCFLPNGKTINILSE